jgi:16S rRNA (adenine1518-N6/adenine1519-N6)-dimethyltransferase
VRRAGCQVRVVRKRFGQHFLAPEWIDKVIRAIDPKADETFIEIGPGRGALTFPLAARASHVTAYEIDRDLAGELRDATIANLTVVEGDFLKQATDAAVVEASLGARTLQESAVPQPSAPSPHRTLRLAGNLPYNVASPIMFRLLELFDAGLPLTDATLMVQREVADRLVAVPGGKEYGVLSVLIQHAARVEMVLKLPPGAFRPPPKVNSALVSLRFQALDPAVRNRAVFNAIVQSVFTRRRKTLVNALLAYGGRPDLKPSEMLNRAELDGSRRPETLSIAEFARLADIYTLG